MRSVLRSVEPWQVAVCGRETAHWQLIASTGPLFLVVM
jgi:hypothetical protein